MFRLDPTAEPPGHQLRDDHDYVPTAKSIVFGHHFTSIAGTGPIVGPALAIM
ncbi:MAG: carbon starvation CstA family protein [Verrucomicrobiales bacterium]